MYFKDNPEEMVHILSRYKTPRNYLLSITSYSIISSMNIGSPTEVSFTCKVTENFPSDVSLTCKLT